MNFYDIFLIYTRNTRNLLFNFRIEILHRILFAHIKYHIRVFQALLIKKFAKLKMFNKPKNNVQYALLGLGSLSFTL